MDLHNITHRALGNRIEITFSSVREEVPAELVGTLMSVEHYITSARGRRDVSTILRVAVGGNDIAVRNEAVSEIATYDESNIKLS